MMQGCNRCVLAVGMLMLGVMARAESERGTESVELADESLTEWSAELSGGWDSLYVSEGRDNLEGDGLVGMQFTAEANGLELGGWYGSSPDTDYDEWNLVAAYGMDAGDFNLYASYTFLSFLTDNEDDHEVGAGIAYGGLPGGVTPAVDWYYSFESEGSFFEVSLSTELVAVDRVVIEPYAVVGVNQGYVAGGHNGANHIAGGLVVTLEVADGIELSGTIAHTWKIDADPERYQDDGSLVDSLYGGIALTFSK